MVHKNLNRPETSLTPFDLLNKNRVYYNIKRQGTITVMIPCLCLFTVLLLAQTSDKQKRTRTLFRKESGSGTNCMVEHCPHQLNL